MCAIVTRLIKTVLCLCLTTYLSDISSHNLGQLLHIVTEKLTCLTRAHYCLTIGYPLRQI